MHRGSFSRRSFVTTATALGLGTASLPASARAAGGTPGPYLPTDESLSTHPTPQWWKDAKFGIFIHWGPYAVPAWGAPMSYQGAEWYMYGMRIAETGEGGTHEHHRNTYGTAYQYDSFIPQFTAERYDPDAWVNLFERAGARYFVLTSKHHDGFQLFPNRASNRNSVVMGPKRDLVGELFEAAQHSRLKRGLYHSLGEFYSPALAAPPWDAYTLEPIPYTGYKHVDDYVSQYLHVMIRTLVERYDPDILWGDGQHWHVDLGAGEIFKPQDMDWRGNEILAYFYNTAHNRPRPKEVLVNDRFEADHRDYAVLEGDKTGYSLRPDPWEACLTFGRSWGYDTNDVPGATKTGPDVVRLLVDIVSKNGNLLFNVGPRADGTIPEWQAERLREVGHWLDTNGSAIYDSTTWTRAEDPDLRYTVGQGTFNIVGLSWPAGSALTVSADLPVASDARIRLLGSRGGHPLDFRHTSAGIEIDLPARNPNGDGYPFVLAVTGP